MKITQDEIANETVQDENTQGRKALKLLHSISWYLNMSKQNKKLVYQTVED